MLSNKNKTVIVAMIGFAIAEGNDPRQLIGQLHLRFETEQDQKWFYDAIFAVEHDYLQYQIEQEQEQIQYGEIYY